MTEQTLPLGWAEVPAEVDRCNWGAFLLKWIWGTGNNTFTALLVFVPLPGLVPFVPGAKGSRWAWRNGYRESVDHAARAFLEATKKKRTWSLGSLKLKIDGRDRPIDLLLHRTRAETDDYRRHASFSAPAPSGQMDGISGRLR